jgi:GT2 family glycosyltransferase
MKITIIIPFKEDRGWLKEAIASVPNTVQLILSKGNGNWPQNFNKALKDATGDLIKFLHEDDMLTPNSIESYIKAFSSPAFNDIDFAHGNTYELHNNARKNLKTYIPRVKNPVLSDLLVYNTIHSASLIYRREVFEKVGGFCELSEVYSFEEFEFNLRCLKAGLKIGYIDAPLAFYRRHPKQIIRTVNIANRKENRKKLVNSYL